MDHLTWIEEIALASVRGDRSQLIGCDTNEVKLVQESQGVERLPEIYIALLTVCGKTISSVFPMCSDCDFANLATLKSEVIERIFHPEKINLPRDAFVFFNHIDYQVLYFRTIGIEDDPAVYEYVEGFGIEVMYEAFSDFLHAMNKL